MLLINVSDHLDLGSKCLEFENGKKEIVHCQLGDLFSALILFLKILIVWL